MYVRNRCVVDYFKTGIKNSGNSEPLDSVGLKQRFVPRTYTVAATRLHRYFHCATPIWMEATPHFLATSPDFHVPTQRHSAFGCLEVLIWSSGLPRNYTGPQLRSCCLASVYDFALALSPVYS